MFIHWPAQADHDWSVANFFPIYPAKEIAVSFVSTNRLLSDTCSAASSGERAVINAMVLPTPITRLGFRNVRSYQRCGDRIGIIWQRHVALAHQPISDDD